MKDPTIDQYLHGKIYKITSHLTDKVYVGSTIQKLRERWTDHIKAYKNYIEGITNYGLTSFEILKYGDAKIELIEFYPTINQYNLEKREGFWVKKLNSVNKRVPGRKEHVDKYQNGKIYKLTSNFTNKIYIGSTVCKLNHRFRGHIYSYNNNYKYCTSYKLLKYADVKIELIENYPTTSKYLLQLRESYWIKKLFCVNKVIPTRTKKQWCIDNKEDIQLKKKIYAFNNKNRLTLYRKNYYLNNKRKILDKQKLYVINNREKRLKQSKIYRQNNKDKIKEQNKLYKIKNKDQLKQKHKNYYSNNREYLINKTKTYY